MATVLQDVKEDGTAYDRQQPKPALAPVRPLGASTPMYGEPQAGPMAQPPAPGGLPSLAGLKTNTPGALPEDQQTPGSSSPTGGAAPGPIPPPPPPVGSTGGGPNVIPPPPPPVGGGPMMPQPPAPGMDGPMVQPPAPPIAPLTPGQPPATLTDFGPGVNDLRYKNVTANDPRLGGTQSQVDVARDSLSSTPDRTKLAADAYALLREQSDPAYQQDIRRVGQAAAKFGRIGAGMTTNELSDLALTRERDLDRSGRQLANEAAGSTMQDRLAKLGALSGLESQQFGQGQAGRDEIRGERGYQNQVDQRARDEEIQRMLLEDQLVGSQFGRDQSRAALLGQLGFGQDPSGTLLGQGNYYGDLADQSGASAADLASLYFAQQAQAGAGAVPAGAARPVVRQPVVPGIDPNDLMVGPGAVP